MSMPKWMRDSLAPAVTVTTEKPTAKSVNIVLNPADDPIEQPIYDAPIRVESPIQCAEVTVSVTTPAVESPTVSVPTESVASLSMIKKISPKKNKKSKQSINKG